MIVELGSTGIQLLSETPSYRMFARDNLIALVERTAEGYGSIGSTGILTERGLAYLVWRDGQAFLAGKGFEEATTEEQVAAVQVFGGLESRAMTTGRLVSKPDLAGIRPSRELAERRDIQGPNRRPAALCCFFQGYAVDRWSSPRIETHRKPGTANLRLSGRGRSGCSRDLCQREPHFCLSWSMPP